MLIRAKSTLRGARLRSSRGCVAWPWGFSLAKKAKLGESTAFVTSSSWECSANYGVGRSQNAGRQGGFEPKVISVRPIRTGWRCEDATSAAT